MLDGLRTRPGPPSGPVVTLTRAAIRPSAVPAFARASRAVTATIGTVPGLRCTVGVGEVPVVRLGTVAVWDDDAAATSAARDWPDHTAAVRMASEAGWFAESLFARFAPYRSAGTWSGRDPVGAQVALG